jgi:transcriptional regulator with XRE-family HTH domain
MNKDNEDLIIEGTKINRVLIGTLISNYLKDNGFTITKLANAAGVSREQIGWLITGKRDPRINTLLRVLYAMKHTLLFEKEE